ncbi:hypothetical protein EI613_28920 [Azospirillum sp. 412522]|nr:hypothetical protein [Azospirillum sp. 412522]
MNHGIRGQAMVFARNGRHPREGGDPETPPANALGRLDSRLRGNDVVGSGRPKFGSGRPKFGSGRPKLPNMLILGCKRLSQSALQ